MSEKLTAEVSITVNAPASVVWKAVTTPSLIKKYLFGTEVTTDWKVGSPITYSGEYQGKKYADKGTIKKFEPERIFESTYWSSMGGKEDKPENYNLVTYTLEPTGNDTFVTITQDNIASEQEKAHTLENWKGVLKGLKEVVENQ